MKSTEAEKLKRLFVCWVPNQTRSASLSLYLGAECYYPRTYFRPPGRVLRYILSPLRYLVQGIETFFALLGKRPDLILVANPPIFASLVVWFYCLFTKARFVTDTHTGAFDRPRWRCFLWLYRFLGKRALTNILHNDPLTKRVACWGLPAVCIGNFPFHLKTDRHYHFMEGFNIVVVCSFDEDEPIYKVIEAARCLPDVNFYITGSLKAAPKQIKENRPTNTILTDFLPVDEYVALLKGADVVVCLTTKDLTLQSGAQEALELERPIITSDWPVLCEAFYRGTIHIDNTSAGLISAIKEMRDRHGVYLNEIKRLRTEQHEQWQKRIADFDQLISSSGDNSK